MGVFSGFFLLDENVTLILCDNLLFQSINRINSACKISFDHRGHCLVPRAEPLPTFLILLQSL